MTRIVLVDDNVDLLESLRRLVSGTEDFELVGAYATAEAALSEVDWSGVDVLLTDLGLPGLTGAQLIAVARGQAPAMLALAFTVHDNREHLFEALRAGASGYLVKGTPAPELLASIRAMRSGETPISPSVATYLVAHFRGIPAGQPAGEECLTSREMEVLRLFTEGRTYNEISDSMGISPHTVHSHVKKIYGKLHINSRKQALRLALDRGYLHT